LLGPYYASYYDCGYSSYAYSPNYGWGSWGGGYDPFFPPQLLAAARGASAGSATVASNLNSISAMSRTSVQLIAGPQAESTGVLAGSWP